MPTLPIYTPPAAADAWNRTLAPGGYESWHVNFSDPAGEMFLVASLMTGCPYHPTYLSQFDRYLDDPTHVAPPLPPDWPCVYVALFRGNKLYAESLVQYPPYGVAASISSLDVHVALDRLWREADGSVRLTLHGRPLVRSPLGPRHPPGSLHLDLTLYSISPPSPPQRLFPEHSGDAEHRWSPIASPCTAKGQLTIRHGAGDDAKAETIPLAGRASLDHDLGTRPFSHGFSAWLRGAAFLPHALIPIRVACAKTRSAEPLAALYDADGRFHPFLPTDAKTTWTRDKRPYPTHLDASPLLRLDCPQILDSRGPVLHLVYRATTPAGQTGHALCRVLHPDRIRARDARAFYVPVGATPG